MVDLHQSMRTVQTAILNMRGVELSFCEYSNAQALRNNLCEGKIKKKTNKKIYTCEIDSSAVFIFSQLLLNNID